MLSHPPLTKRLTVFCPDAESIRAPGDTAGPQLTALQPIWLKIHKSLFL